MARVAAYLLSAVKLAASIKEKIAYPHLREIGRLYMRGEPRCGIGKFTLALHGIIDVNSTASL